MGFGGPPGTRRNDKPFTGRSYGGPPGTGTGVARPTTTADRAMVAQAQRPVTQVNRPPSQVVRPPSQGGGFGGPPNTQVQQPFVPQPSQLPPAGIDWNEIRRRQAAQQTQGADRAMLNTAARQHQQGITPRTQTPQPSVPQPAQAGLMRAATSGAATHPAAQMVQQQPQQQMVMVIL